MIMLAVPSQGQQLYLQFGEFLLGPYGSGSGIDRILEVETPSTFYEADGKYGEGAVLHSHSHGYVTYQPVLVSCIFPAPIAGYPNRMGFRASNGVGGYDTYYANCGITDGTPTYGLITASAGSVSHFGIKAENGTIWYTKGTARTSVPNSLDCTIMVYSNIRPGTGTSFLSDWVSSSALRPCVSMGSWLSVRSFNELYSAATSCLYSSTSLLDKSGKQYCTVAPSYLTDAALTAMVEGQLRLATYQEIPPDGRVYGELAQEASERFQAVRINVLEFLSDLRHPQDLIPKLRNLRHIRTWASNYLSMTYGVLPTISDVQSLIDSFKRHAHYDRNGFECAYGGRTESWIGTHNVNCSLERHVKLAIDTNDKGFDRLCRRIENMGILPTFSNIWDLVPYSFLIDWLADVGGFLDSVDARQRIARLDIRYVTMSRKIKNNLTFVPTIECPLSGQLEWVEYHRWVSDHCPTPPLSLQFSVTDFDHWLESAALIVQRRSK